MCLRPCPLAIRSSMPGVPGGAIFSGAAFGIKVFKEKQVDDSKVQEIERLPCALKQVFEYRHHRARHSDVFRPCYIMLNGELCKVLPVYDRIYFDPVSEHISIAMDGAELPGYSVLDAHGRGATIEKMASPWEHARLAARIYYQVIDIA
jgi:hypothetical protein